MRQQVAQRYGFLRRAQLRNPFRIETGENLGRPKRRIDIAGRLVQLQIAALTSCSAATDVSSLTIEAMLKTVSVDMRDAAAMSREPNAPS